MGFVRAWHARNWHTFGDTVLLLGLNHTVLLQQEFYDTALFFQKFDNTVLLL